MKGKGTAGWMVVVSGVLLLGGCTGTGSDKADLNSQVQQLKTSLDATKNERDLLEQDVRNSSRSLTRRSRRWPARHRPIPSSRGSFKT